MIVEMKYNGQKWYDVWPEMGGTASNGGVVQLDPVATVSALYIPEGIMSHAFVKDWEPPTEAIVIADDRVLELAKLLGLSDADVEARNKKVAHFANGNGPKQLMVQLAQQAKELQRERIKEAVPVLVAYAHAACGGELRYHPDVASASPTVKTRKNAWVAWRAIWEKHGDAALIEMAKLFRTMKGGSIGGERWAVAADILLAYHQGKLGPTPESNDKMFVDRVLALEHNGGCFLNKRVWINHRVGRTEKIGITKVEMLAPAGIGMTPVLNCHASNPPDLNGLYACADAQVQGLLLGYLTAAKEAGLKIVGDWNEKQNPPPSPITTASKWSPIGTIYETPTASKWSPIGTIYETPVLDQIAKLGEVPGAAGLIAKSAFKLKTDQPFEVHFKINKVKDGNNSHINVQSYKFSQLSALLIKKFHFAHMLKSTMPGAKTLAYSVWLKQNNAMSLIEEVESNFPIGAITGANLWKMFNK